MTAVVLRGVGKRYVKYDDAPALINHARALWGRSRRSDLWAVRDLDLEIESGESVGVIGHNGSGKSTTLQLLCGVTAPTVGEVRVRGRVAPLISVGVGFHPELTGRENVYINGAILGLSRREIDAKYDAIVDFAGVHEFMDTPIKFYSSGMTVRLGFAVAAHADPEVLLVDEVLAVGDLAFQLKCFEHMSALKAGGTTIVVVSHNLNAINRLCARTVVLKHGALIFDGGTDDAITVYHHALATADRDANGAAETAREIDAVEIVDLALTDALGKPSAHFACNERVRAVVRVRGHRTLDRPFLTMLVTSASGVPIYHEHNLLHPFPRLLAGADATWVLEFDARLPSGTFGVRVDVARAAHGEGLAAHDALSDVTILTPPTTRNFYVSGRPGVSGVADLGGRFTVQSRADEEDGAE